MEKYLEKIIDGAVDLGIKLVIALVIIGVGFKIANAIENKMRKRHKFEKLDESARGFIASFVGIAIKCLMVVIAISILDVPTSSIIAVVGSCGVAIGLALQGGLSNIAGGLMILIFKPFKVGDYIDTHSDEGTVKSISMFYTTLKTADNKLVMLPNGTLTNSTVVNLTGAKTRRVDIDLSVAYNTNINKVKKLVNTIIDKHELVLQDEEKVVRLKEHGDSALVFTVRVWVKTDDYWSVKFDLLEEIKDCFDKNKIEIPYPQVDVHMKK